MAEYKLEVTTGDMQYAGTWDHIYITLIGAEGQSERTELDNFGIDFKTGTVSGIQLEIAHIVILKLGLLFVHIQYIDVVTVFVALHFTIIFTFT